MRTCLNYSRSIFQISPASTASTDSFFVEVNKFQERDHQANAYSGESRLNKGTDWFMWESITLDLCETD